MGHWQGEAPCPFYRGPRGDQDKIPAPVDPAEAEDK